MAVFAKHQRNGNKKELFLIWEASLEGLFSPWIMIIVQ